MNYIELTHNKLSVGEISDLVAAPSCGAISMFMGTTRDSFENKRVVSLEYEVYEGMAVKTIEGICKDIREKWPSVENIAVYHRLGNVPIKEVSIVIAVSSPHRSEAMAATQWCIDNVKKTVTIWKKEIYHDSVSEWKENKESSTNPKKITLFKSDDKPTVELSHVYPHNVQINASDDEIRKRIDKFIERKRDEINQSNVRDFCEEGCNNAARIDVKMVKRKDSKGHLPVSRAYNVYHRDRTNFDYMKSYAPTNGLDERIKNIEVRLGFDFPANKDIYEKLKDLEDRILYLESLSPEYVQLWEKLSFAHREPTNKKVYSVNDIDRFIAKLEAKRNKLS